MAARQPGRAVTRERLLTTAEDVFFTHGYGATSVDAVAAAAGFTTGAIYSNFGGKADLFLAVLERVAERDLAAMRAAVDQASSDDEVLGVLANAMAGSDDRWRGRVAASMEFIATARAKPELRHRIDAAQQRVDDLLGELLLAINRGLGLPPPADLRGLSRAVNAMVSGYAVRVLFEDVDVAVDITNGVTALVTGTAAMVRVA